jgi:hypothetical protein
MRQSEGNRTENKLSAERRKKGVRPGQARSEAIDRPTTTFLAWTARIRSSLLLKTASLGAAESPAAANSYPEYSGDHAR